MERVREAVDLARRAAARDAPEAGRRGSSLSSSQQPSQSSAERSINDTSAARLRLARLLPDTPADQLLASLEASSGSSAGELKDFLSACLDSAASLAPLVASGEASEAAGSAASSRLASLTLSTLNLLTSLDEEAGGSTSTGARRAAETPALGRLLARLVAVVLPQHLPAMLRGSVEALEKAAPAAAVIEGRGGASSSSSSNNSPSACAARAALEVLSAGLSSLGRINVSPAKRFVVYKEKNDDGEAGSGDEEEEGGEGRGGAGNAIDEDASFDPLELQASVVSRVLALRRWPAQPSAVVGALRAAPLLSAEQAMALAARALRTASSSCTSSSSSNSSVSSSSAFADVAPLARQVLLLRPARAAGAALLGLAKVLDGLYAFEEAKTAGKTSSSSSSAASAAAAAAASDAAAAVLLEVELAAKSGGVPEAAAVAWTRSLAARASPSAGGAALLLTLAGVPRLASQAINDTVRALSGAFKAEAVAVGSRWAGKLPSLPLPAGLDLEEALVGAVSHGRDRLLGSALALASVLLDGAPLVAASAVLGADDGDGGEGEKEEKEEEDGKEDAEKATSSSSSSSSLRSSPNLPPDERGARLGARLLVAAYGASRMGRGDVLRLLCGRLAASAGGWAAEGGGRGGGSGNGSGNGGGGEHAAARGVPHCIAALGEIARSHPEDLGGAHADALREALALAGALPAAQGGSALLSALWPAARRSRGARDAAALALRKAAFSREPAARATAARGLLMAASAEARAASLALEEAREGAAAAAAAAASARAAAAAAAASDGNDDGDPGPSQQQQAAAPSQQQQQPAATVAAAAAAAAAAQAQAFHCQQFAASSATAVQELGGLLRRALAQQEAVRTAVYGAAPSLVRADVSSSSAAAASSAATTTATLASLLAPHLDKFVGDGTPRGGAPLRLDLAIIPVARLSSSSAAAAAALDDDDDDEEARAAAAAAASSSYSSSAAAAGVRVVEPLAALLSCARLSVLAARGRRVGSAAVSAVEAAAGTTTRRADPVSSLSLAFARARDGVLASVPEDYGLDKTSGLGGNNSNNRSATCPTLGAARAGALAASLEVLMEDAAAAALSRDEPADQAAARVSAAFKVHERLRRMLLQLLVASAATGGGGGGGSSSSSSAAAAAVGSKRGRDGGSSSSCSAPASFALGALLRSHLSPEAVAVFLDALVEDGMKPKARFVPPQNRNRNSSAAATSGDGGGDGGGGGTAAAATSPSLGEGARLARDKHFQAFVLRSATALLLASQSSFAVSSSTMNNNNGNNPAARAAAAAAAAASPWARRARAVLARPLLRAAGMIASAYSGTRGGGTAAAGAGGGGDGSGVSGGGASASVAAALLGGGGNGAAAAAAANPAATAALLAGDSKDSLVMLAVQAIGVLLRGAALGGDLREVLGSAGEEEEEEEGEEGEEEEEEEEEEDEDVDNGGNGKLRPQSTWLPVAARLLDRLSESACWKELEALCTVLTGVTARIGGDNSPSFASSADCRCAPLAAAARKALSSKELSHGPAVRSLVALLVSSSRPERGEDLEAAHDVARAVAEVLAVVATAGGGGGADNDNSASAAASAAASVAAAAAAASEALPAVNSRTLPAAAGAVAEALNAALADVAWALARTREAAGNSSQSSGGGGKAQQQPSAAATAAAALASAAAADASCDRLRALLAPLAELARASGLSVRAPRAGDRTLLAVRAAYRALTAAVKLAGTMTAAAGANSCSSSSLSAAARPALRPAFSALVAAAHETLGPAAQGMILDSENTAAVTAGSVGCGGSGGGTPATATASKPSNAAAASSNGARAPEVVFAAEAFDAALIKLGAATRTNLMRGARRAMARDFRITLNDSTTTTGGGGGGHGGCAPATGYKRGGSSVATAGAAARRSARDTPLVETNAN